MPGQHVGCGYNGSSLALAANGSRRFPYFKETLRLFSHKTHELAGIRDLVEHFLEQP